MPFGHNVGSSNLLKVGVMLRDYFENYYRADLNEISCFGPDKNSLMYSPELTRGLQFIDVSSIKNVKEKNRKNFVFVLFILNVLDQICYRYFGEYKSKFNFSIISRNY